MTTTTTYDEKRTTAHHIIRLTAAGDLDSDDREALDSALADAVSESESGDWLERERCIDYDARHLPYHMDAEMTVRRTELGRRLVAQKMCEDYLESWDRHEWMATHGEWASEAWDSEREAYDEAVTDLRDAVDALPAGEVLRGDDELDALAEAARKVAEAARKLDGQVCPDDERDYIAEGTLDPDGVADTAEKIEGAGESWSGWDCREGWQAYADDGRLYLRWYREAWGSRHDRDLWVHVADKFDE